MKKKTYFLLLNNFFYYSTISSSKTNFFVAWHLQAAKPLTTVAPWGIDLETSLLATHHYSISMNKVSFFSYLYSYNLVFSNSIDFGNHFVIVNSLFSKIFGPRKDGKSN